MTWANPQLLWLLVSAPLVALLAGWLWRRRLRATSAWVSRGLWPRLAPGLDSRRLVLATVLLTVATAGVASSLARPRWGVVEEEVEHRGADVVFVLDSSLSMGAVDVRPDRLAVGKVLIRRMADSLPGHRIGVVQAEGEGRVLAPLTFDRGVVDIVLESAEPATLPTPGTVLSTGLHRAMELLPEPAERSTRGIVVLVSDGEDHSENPLQGIDDLAESGVAIHAVGVGTREGSPLPIPGSSPVEYKTDRFGDRVHSRLEPSVLQRLAAVTGGRFVEATGAGVDLGPIVDAIAGAAGGGGTVSVVTRHEERFQWFLVPAAAALLVLLSVSPYRPPGVRS